MMMIEDDDRFTDTEQASDYAKRILYDPTKPWTVKFDFDPDVDSFSARRGLPRSHASDALGYAIHDAFDSNGKRTVARRSLYDRLRGWLYRHETAITWTLHALSLTLSIIAIILASGCRRETPIADQPARTASDSSASSEAAKQEAPSPAPAIRDEAFERVFVETFERAMRPQTATRTTQPLMRPPTHIVHFASPVIPLQVFRVDDHPPITVDGLTYRPSRYAFIAIDIADVMRSERACLFVDRQPRLTAGTCFWPQTWGRGKWMVVPVDTSPVVQFRRRSGPNILPAMKIADLPTISAAELK